jgi:predicted metal-binding protein
MAGEIESHMVSLCEEAKKLGAKDAKAIKSSDIIVDPRVSLKCRVPICYRYGNNLTCPPHVMSASEFQEILTRYAYAVLIEVEASFPDEVIQAAKKADNMAEFFSDKNNVKPLLARTKEFAPIIDKIEAIAFNLGYRFAAGFSVGACILCDECVTKHPGEPCRHPFKARPSMEAVGIDVFKTAERAGFKPVAATMDKVVGYGMVLVD